MKPYSLIVYQKRGEELLNIEIKPGLKPRKLSGKPEIIENWDKLQSRVLKGEKFVAEYHDTENHHYLETVFSPIKEGKKVTGFTEITRDITERKQVEKELHDSHAFNSSLLDHSPNAIGVYNPDI